METLLEPSGKILHTYGMEKHLEDIEQLIRAFRILIETILADEEFFFKGTFGPYNVNQNFLLRHSKYYEQMTGLDADGQQIEKFNKLYSREFAKHDRQAIFTQMKIYIPVEKKKQGITNSAYLAH